MRAYSTMLTYTARKVRLTFVCTLFLMALPFCLSMELVTQAIDIAASPPRCLAGWITWYEGMSCYRIFQWSPSSDGESLKSHVYNYTSDSCQRKEAHMLTITSAAENAFVTSAKGLIHSWFATLIIGLTRTDTGKWLWSTGEQMNYNNWGKSDDTVSSNNVYRCARLTLDGDWLPVGCFTETSIIAYICEYHLPGHVASDSFWNGATTTGHVASDSFGNGATTTVSSKPDERLVTDAERLVTNAERLVTDVERLVPDVTVDTHNTTVTKDTSTDTEWVLFVVLPTAAGLVVLSVAIVLIYKCRTQTKLRNIRAKRNALDKGKPKLSDILIAMLDNDKKWKLQNLLVHRDALTVHEELGQGAFGIIHKGIYNSDNSRLGIQTVAVKTFKERCIGSHIASLVEEAITMSEFNHTHILSIIAVCIRPDDGIPMLLLPYMDNGDLKTYLRQFCFEKRDVEPPDEKQLIIFSLQIARGMEYLTEQKFVHRDLAARNCMLDKDFVVKVGDFGLTRDVYMSSYYRLENQKLLLVKWMAPESLEFHVFNFETDIWAFGVTMWEVFSMGRVPYPQLENQDVQKHVNSGVRLRKPTNCPDEMYYVMLECWNAMPEQRPSFAEISKLISDYAADMCCYLNMDENTTCDERPNTEDQSIYADGTKTVISRNTITSQNVANSDSKHCSDIDMTEDLQSPKQTAISETCLNQVDIVKEALTE